MNKRPKLSHTSSAKHKQRNSQSTSDLDIELKTAFENQSAAEVGSTPDQWKRRGEGFRLADDKHKKGPSNQVRRHKTFSTPSITFAGQQTTQAKSQKSFGERWIQTEELFNDFSIKKQGQGTVSASHQASRAKASTSGSNNLTTTDRCVEDILWSDSESDTEKQHNPCITSTATPTKKTICVNTYSKPRHKTRRKRQAAKAQTVRDSTWIPADKNDDESDSNTVISASESDEESRALGQRREAPSVSTDPSPDFEIEFMGSPQHKSSPSPGKSYAGLPLHVASQEDVESPCKSPEVGVSSISSCVSSQAGATSDSSPPQGGLKASEWARKVKLEVTPSKQQPQTPIDHGDSGKKKKKFVKGGLAEQMSRILLREKSASRIWQHQCRPDDSQQDCKSLTVRVHSVQTVLSLQLADCSVPGPVSALSDLHPASPRCLVLFSPTSTLHTGALQPGASVCIYPPWQQLNTSPSHSVLLCTRCVISNQTSAASDRHCAEVSGRGEVDYDTCLPPSPQPACHGRWLCPCSTDKETSAARCPAHLFPFLPASLLLCTSPATPTSTATASATVRMLHTVTENKGGAKKTLTFDTLLESIERCHSKDKVLPGFQATVLRVFREQESGSKRASLLLEDSQGTVALVTGANFTSNIEGQLCCFSDLHVHSRTNADRDPALFSAIAAAWSDRVNTEAASQASGAVAVSSDSFNNSQCLMQIPGFCYLLEVNGTGATQASQSVDPSLVWHPRPLTVTCLAQALLSPQQNVRATFLVKVIYHCLEDRTQTPEQLSGDGSSVCRGPALLFVCDHSLLNVERHHRQGEEAGPQDVLQLAAGSSPGSTSPGYVKVRVQDDCVTDSIMQESLRQNDLVPYLMLVRDAWLINGTVMDFVLYSNPFTASNGSWIADKYSTLVPLDGEDGESAAWRSQTDLDLRREVMDCSIHLLPVSASTLPHSLVSLTGVIEGVDEKSAFSWEECDSCGSDQLAAKSATQTLVCLKCRKVVTSPEQRMAMEVTVRPDDSPSLAVTIKLLQLTIHNLLPTEENEEGYDIDCVLNKHLGPLKCAITSLSKNASGVTLSAVELPI